MKTQLPVTAKSTSSTTTFTAMMKSTPMKVLIVLIIAISFLAVVTSSSASVLSEPVPAREQDDAKLSEQKEIIDNDEQEEPESCGLNERYTNCASSTCFEERCREDVLYPIPGFKRCTRDCIKGCQCIPGYFRNDKGRCVSELSCRMCGYYEDWKEYDGTEGFELSCDDAASDVTANTTEVVDNQGESVGFAGFCKCAEGYYRSEEGLCVSEEACKQCTNTNEFWELCGSSSCWEDTCDDKDTPLRERLIAFCTLDCREGCKCYPGFYRDIASGDCVSAFMCPPP
jgi:hypothetical protein